MLKFSHPPTMELQHFQNPKKLVGEYPENLQRVLSLQDTKEAFKEISSWSGYQATELHRLQDLAAALNVSAVHYKDESNRFGLGSFKALGGAYGVQKFLLSHLKKQIGFSITSEGLRKGQYLSHVSNVTVITATDGNHGRSVAWGAKYFGCACKVYVHKGVSLKRQEAIQAFGAEVIKISGTYDEAVRAATTAAKENDWHVISDTSYPGYVEIPKSIMAGYTVMVEELAKECDGKLDYSHIFLQGGVGALAASVTAAFWQKHGKHLPKIIVVEPTLAPCLMASAKAGKPEQVTIEKETIMAGLSCGEASLLAWEILSLGVDDFLLIADEAVPPIMRTLANGWKDDPKIEAGESAVAGLAGLLAVCADPHTAKTLEIDKDSKILVFGTEGATDREIYQAIIAG